MRTHSPLVVDVVELLEAPGTRRHLAFSAPVGSLEVGLVAVRDDVRFDLTLEAVDGGILVQGLLGGAYSGSCRRCLAGVAHDFEVHPAELYRPSGEVWEEGYVIDHGTIDLAPLVRDAVGLNIPFDPLCRPDCKGLCQRCGADLNEGACGCPEDIDPRWSALKELGPSSGGSEPVS
jgi:uncharacterized protein